MGFEPNARRRLRLVATATADPVLQNELAIALEEETMSLVPSVDLARAIARCPHCRPADVGTASREGLCEVHRSQWNLEACTTLEPAADREVMTGGYLESLLRRALATEDGGTQFLAAYERQARALDAVWEAHRRGAVHLPAAVADKVEEARVMPPRFLRGGGGGVGSEARVAGRG